MRAGLYILMFLLVVSCQSKQEGNAMSSFVDEYFNALFEWSPSTATAMGFHQYDSKIEDFPQAAISRRIDRLKQLESGLMRARTGKLTVDEEIDADIIGSQIKAELLDIETLQTWRHNPMNYVGLPGGTIDGLMKRNFAPPAERLRSMVSRLKGVPALMKAMKENIQNPPHELTDPAVRSDEGSGGYVTELVHMVL